MTVPPRRRITSTGTARAAGGQRIRLCPCWPAAMSLPSSLGVGQGTPDAVGYPRQALKAAALVHPGSTTARVRAANRVTTEPDAKADPEAATRASVVRPRSTTAPAHRASGVSSKNREPTATPKPEKQEAGVHPGTAPPAARAE